MAALVRFTYSGNMSAQDALNKYYAKQLREFTKKPKKKNQSPEADFKKEAMAWLNSKGFSVHSIESKAVWNPKANRYIRGQTDSGFSDLVGVTPTYGVACFIELKAPGRRSTLKEHQKHFLISKIDKMAFAICTDSIAHIDGIFMRWQDAFMRQDFMEAKKLLLQDLP